jgi:cold shock CspA family protein
MRMQGRVSEWKDDRGFGFIAPNGGGAKLFLHISSFSDRLRRPAVGDLVTYELSTNNNGRPQAKATRFISDRGQSHHRRTIGFLGVVAGALVLAFIAYVAYVRVSHPNSTVQASVYKIFRARAALQANPQFQCEPSQSSCAHMKSCAEAFFHQERCGVERMDGDRDGIPCEQQWCN